MDVISNPDLLRVWCESIDALVVTDHKGGSPKTSLYAEEEEIRYQEPDLEQYDDDMIVPPASEAPKAAQRCQPREQYDGEWIQASTSEIIPPPSHTNIVDECVRKTRNILGFSHYGSVSMFIERNLSQVGFTVGPFKGGITLSHKIMVRGIDSGYGVMIIDEVKLLKGDSEYDDGEDMFCSCLQPWKELIAEWSTPGIDGYVNQARTSLINLVYLIERGGENDVRGDLILASACNDDTLRTPLLLV